MATTPAEGATSTMMSVEIPRRLRAIVRARESSLIVLAAFVGACGGVVVVTMAMGVDLLHALLFGLTPGERLSDQQTLDPLRALSVPLIGGLLLGLLPLILRLGALPAVPARFGKASRGDR